MSLVLESGVRPAGFEKRLAAEGLALARRKVTTLQINVGKLCNQACHHCHVDAGPKRTEIMDARVADRLLVLLERSPEVALVDLTGGAPELNPHFRRFVRTVRAMGRAVIDRCNLTVLFEPGQGDLAEFLAAHEVSIVASLPCYSEANVDRQRGRGVFGKSIEALQTLNGLGYGVSEGRLGLTLVYNPVGAHLPPDQAKLEADYKQRLHDDFGIAFDRLITITNMPISRFAHMLKRDGDYEAYMQLLIDAFNPQAVEGVMCRDLVSVGFDGQLYDCDFNQMLEMPVRGRRTIFDIEGFDDLSPAIQQGDHCFGCTAGAGSSCGGALV